MNNMLVGSKISVLWWGRTSLSERDVWGWREAADKPSVSLRTH